MYEPVANWSGTLSNDGSLEPSNRRSGIVEQRGWIHVHGISAAHYATACTEEAIESRTLCR